jgi:GntR family transcriptional regulator/MocR family aminotransferase
MTIAVTFLDDIVLSRDKPEALRAQLARELRRFILRGALVPGARLPATRICAQRLGVGRNVVTDAYDTLISEGLLTAYRGAGTFVALRDATAASADKSAPAPRPEPADMQREIAWASRLTRANADLCGQPDTKRAFVPGVPALRQFPADAWSRAATKAMRDPQAVYLADIDPKGLPALREAISAHVGPSRGIACSPDQVIVLTGARQGFEMAIRLLTDIGDPVMVEDPGYVEARAVVAGLGRRIIGCPVGPHGLRLAADFSGAPLFIVTPAHQYPTGGRMSPATLHALLDKARQQDCILVEDDYDGEFHHGGQSAPCLSGVDDLKRTIHIGTFSKSMFPGLRLGYMITPPALGDPMARLRGIMDGQPSSPLQAIMAAFIRSGAFARHLRRMRELYTQRTAALQDVIDRLGGGVLTPLSSDSGLHLCCHIPPGVDDVALVARLRAAGIGATALSLYHLSPDAALPGLVIGFGNTEAGRYDDLIRQIVATIKVAL